LSVELKRIFLDDYHKDNNAKFVPFAGYAMPINYENGIIKENLQVRSLAGLFDVSHMGQILIPVNKSNTSNLEKFIPLNLFDLTNNKSYYTFILNNKGGVIDDIILSKIKYQENEYFFIVYNASRKEADECIFIEILTGHIFLKNNSLLAIQGPLSENVLNFLPDIKSLKFMNSVVLNYLNHSIIVTRSGYTGEDGFEISIPNLIIKDFIKQIMLNVNIKLCGLGARDSLRLEAGLSLYGNELNESITPIEANFKWTIHKDRLNNSNLNGDKILLQQIANGVNKQKIAVKSLSKSILRNDMKLIDNEENEIGYITSGTFSPTIKSSIAIGYVDRKMNVNERIFTKIRNNIEELEIVKLPFVLHKYKKG
jgi:aminomethyltransferase